MIRFGLAFYAAVVVATPLSAGEAEDPLDIFVVRGGTAELERFHAEVGKGWRGGKFLDRLSSKTEFRYWAYPSRSASEARTFIFGSLSFGVRLDVEAYDEATYYPKERALLDGVVSRCRLKSDPFFIEPDRPLIMENGSAQREGQDCARSELKKTILGRELPVRSPSVEQQTERG